MRRECSRDDDSVPPLRPADRKATSPSRGATQQVRHLTTTTFAGSSTLAKAPACDRPMLLVLRGRQQGAVFSIPPRGVQIGRDTSADVTLSDDTVSREHAVIALDDCGAYVEDHASRNGTFVNEQRISGRTLLTSGDRLRFGDIAVIKFSMVDELEENALQTLFELSSRDPLTRLYNRRYLDDRIEGEFSFARRHGTSLAMFLIDIDHFKHVNDTFGHQVGDEVLKRVSTQVRAVMRPEDVLARYGGEEFVVVARNTSPARAAILAERIRATFEKLGLAEGGPQITASVGFACAGPKSFPANAQALVGAADRALYRAKDLGRNRVVAAPAPSDSAPPPPGRATIPPAAP